MSSNAVRRPARWSSHIRYTARRPREFGPGHRAQVVRRRGLPTQGSGAQDVRGIRAMNLTNRALRDGPSRWVNSGAIRHPVHPALGSSSTIRTSVGAHAASSPRTFSRHRCMPGDASGITSIWRPAAERNLSARPEHLTHDASNPNTRRHSSWSRSILSRPCLIDVWSATIGRTIGPRNGAAPLIAQLRSSRWLYRQPSVVFSDGPGHPIVLNHKVIPALRG